MPNATSDGVRIHYEVEGAGPPLVLSHGWLGLVRGGATPVTLRPCAPATA